MKAFLIGDLSSCMQKLLTQDTFDAFLLLEARINGKIQITMDGHPAEGFLSGEGEDEARSPVPYGQVKRICYEAIRGKRVPVSFRFILQAPPSMTKAILAETGEKETDVSFFLNFQYKEDRLTLTTGLSRTGFSLDRDLPALWDREAEKFLADAGIATENLL